MSRDKVHFVLDLLDSSKISYGEARFVHLRQQIVATKNGKPSFLDERDSTGIGVRVLVKGSWGFAASPFLTRAGLEDTVRRALETACASSFTNGPCRLKLAAAPAQQAFWGTRVEIDPWSVDPREKTAHLVECEAILRKDRRIFLSEARMEFTRKEQIFGSTEGAFIESSRAISGAGFSCKARSRGEIQRRSYPSISRGYASGGYEVIRSLALLENAARVREEAVKLLRAPACPARELDLILKGPMLALQIHESIGHAAELDRIFGYEDNLGGRTYLIPERIGKWRVGSPWVTVVANRSAEEKGAGFVAFDDEGVSAKETVIVKGGVFQGYLSSRETAGLLGSGSPTGSMIAEDWSHAPIIRMTNLSLLPGDKSLEALISEMREGLILDAEASWSIDEERRRFQLGAELAWYVRKGKIAGVRKNPVYWGDSESFWGKCAGVADEKSFALSGFADCGKGGPYQNAFVAHGCAPALFRGVPCGAGRA
jgi:TldD protein